MLPCYSGALRDASPRECRAELPVTPLTPTPAGRLRSRQLSRPAASRSPAASRPPSRRRLRARGRACLCRRRQSASTAPARCAAGPAALCSNGHPRCFTWLLGMVVTTGFTAAASRNCLPRWLELAAAVGHACWRACSRACSRPSPLAPTHNPPHTHAHTDRPRASQRIARQVATTSRASAPSGRRRRTRCAVYTLWRRLQLAAGAALSCLLPAASSSAAARRVQPPYANFAGGPSL